MFTGTQRSKNILTRVRIALGNPDDLKMPSDNIFFIATEKQRDIAETYMVLESSMDLSIVANTADYDLTGGSVPTGFFRKKLIAPPSGSRSIIFELDVNEFDFYKRYTRVSTGLPIWYVKIWQGTLTFFPTPTATETWKLFFYKSPITTISKTVAPELSSSFDSAIVFATVMELDPAQFEKYLPLYEQALERAINSYRATRTEIMQLTYRDV